MGFVLLSDLNIQSQGTGYSLDAGYSALHLVCIPINIFELNI